MTYNTLKHESSPRAAFGFPIPVDPSFMRAIWRMLFVALALFFSKKMNAADLQNAKIRGGWEAAVTEKQPDYNSLARKGD